MWSSFAPTRRPILYDALPSVSRPAGRSSLLSELSLPALGACCVVPSPWFGFGIIVANFSGDEILLNCGHVLHASQPAPAIAAQLGYPIPDADCSPALRSYIACVSASVYVLCPDDILCAISLPFFIKMVPRIARFHCG